MADFGIKITDKNKAISDTTLKAHNFMVYSKYPMWKVDVRETSATHYGQVTHSFLTIPPASTTFDIYRCNHGYSYKPSFLVQYKTVGYGAADVYGLGNPFLSPADGQYNVYVDNTYLHITFTVSPIVGAAIIGKGATMRFYIFAEDIESTYIA